MEETKPEGYALSLIVQKTGIAEGTIKSLLSRHAELQDLPYSTKAAGSRVFFDAFVEWLAAHQGAEVAKVASPATSATRAAKLPAGIQLREMRMIYGAPEAAKRLDLLLGYSKPVPMIEATAGPAEARLGFAALKAIAAGLPSDTVAKAARAGAAATEAVIRREIAKAQSDSMQTRLEI